jgi:predicted acyl esterase
MISANIYHPDAQQAGHPRRRLLPEGPGSSAAAPHLPMRETNDIDYFVSCGYVFVHTDSRGTATSDRQWDLGQDMQNDLYDMISG